MPEVDSGKKVNFSGLIEIILPYFKIDLDEFSIKNKSELSSKREALEEIEQIIQSKVGIKCEEERLTLDIALEDMLVRQRVPMQKWRFNDYYLREKSLINTLEENKINPFKGGLPVFVSGKSVSNERTFVKSGFDPYSKSHKLSDNILKSIHGLYQENKEYKEFLESVFFIYLQPSTFIQMVRFDNDLPVLIDYLSFFKGNPFLLKILKEETKDTKKKNIIELKEHLKKSNDSIEKDILSYEDFYLDKNSRIRKEIYKETISERKELGKATYSDFSLELFDFSRIKKTINDNKRAYEKSISKFQERIEKTAEIMGYNSFNVDTESYLLMKKAQTDIAKRIMAYKISYLLDMNSVEISNFIKRYQTNGLPIFMEKTSYDLDIMKSVISFSSFFKGIFGNSVKQNDYIKKNNHTNNLKEVDTHSANKRKNKNNNANFAGLDFIGGKHGPLEFAKNNSLGICDPSAIKKLCGFLIDKSDIFYKGKYAIKGFDLRDVKRKNFPRIEYESLADFPYFLIESNLIDAHPNILDLIQYLIKTKEITKQDLRILESYSREKWIGWSRIEARIVELFSNDTYIQIGLFSPKKRIGRWLDELNGKTLLYPLKEINFESFVVNDENPKLNAPDFRLSMFSLPTNPKLDKGIFEGNRFLGGCPIDKFITSLSLEEKGLLLDGFSESKMARKGNLIHLISAMEFNTLDEESGLEKELSHYQTLELLGLKATSPKAYSETAFRVKYNLGDLSNRSNSNYGETEIGFHPDAYFLLGYDSSKISRDYISGSNYNKYDIVIIDTKTNSFLPYFEHKYLLQTLSYGRFVKSMIENILEKNCVENIYVVLNKNAFHINMPNNIEKGTVRYRPQVFSPIVKFSKEDEFMGLFENILNESIEALVNLRSNLKENINGYYALSKKEKYCNRCFFDHQLICEQLQKNPDILENRAYKEK